jgi:predicted DCC family thiol-disulfide oxidoreductase YuxK
MSENPPFASRFVVLYDGHCKFCTHAARRLTTLARAGAVEAVDFQEPGALDRYPGLTYEACMEAMYLVAPDGQFFRGFEAAVQALATRSFLGMLARVYYLPGIRQVCDRLYAWVAANRYRLFGRTVVDHCAEGTCALHFPRTMRTARKQQEEADKPSPTQGELL